VGEHRLGDDKQVAALRKEPVPSEPVDVLIRRSAAGSFFVKADFAAFGRSLAGLEKKP
jgi:hypothetical protein